MGADNKLARLPEALHGEHVEIILIAPAGSYLLSSKFVDERVELIPQDETEGWIATVVRNGSFLAGLDVDFFLLGLDALTLAIAQSELPTAVKTRILPMRNERALHMVGSKVGLARAMAESLAGGPESRIAHSREEFESITFDLALPYVVKGDQGAGGSAVAIIDQRNESIPDSWFPVVIQEYLPGTEVGVEALFVEGRLAGWLYSHVVATVAPKGPSSARRFVNPPSRDFEEKLNLLGSYGDLHGMFNVSMMWNPVTRAHSIFEVDARPNVWFQFGRTLGVDWSLLMSKDDARASPLVPPEGTLIRLFPHEIVAGIREGNIRRLLLWFGSGEGTYGTRNHQDPAVNRHEAKLVRMAIKERVARVLIAINRKLPAPIASALKELGIANFVARMASRPFS